MIPAPKVSKYKFIGCEITYREVCHLAASLPQRVDVEFLRKGLHDLPSADMRQRVQSAIDSVSADDGYDAILLGYARCNDGLAGVMARNIPLVIPRAHDCITFFFGSAGRYKAYFDANPGTYYMTTGWAERNHTGQESTYAQPAYGKTGVMGQLGLAQSYEDMVARYGQENADFIRETLGDWRKNYNKYLYLKMGVCDESGLIAATQADAGDRGWAFELREGSMDLLRRLIAGPWDDDFVVVQPGQSLVARNDERILDVE